MYTNNLDVKKKIFDFLHLMNSKNEKIDTEKVHSAIEYILDISAECVKNIPTIQSRYFAYYDTPYTNKTEEFSDFSKAEWQYMKDLLESTGLKVKLNINEHDNSITGLRVGWELNV